MKVAFKLRTGEELKPEDILGMSAEDLKKGLENGKVAADKVAELSTKLDAVTSGFDEVKQLLAKAAGQRSDGGNSGGDGGNGGAGDGGDELDPATKLALAATKSSMETKAEMVKARVRDKQDSTGYMFPHWDALAADIEKIVEKDPLSVKQHEAYWENVYHIAFSKRHKEFIDKPGRRLFTSEPVTASNAGQGGGDKKDEPTQTDIAEAKKWGIPIEKYMESKKNLRFVS